MWRFGRVIPTLLLCVVAAVITACHGGAHPEFTVNSGLDASDANPGDGVCATPEGAAGGGLCTLRAAIDEANALTGGDTATIHLATDVTLSIPGVDENANATGDLDINHGLTVQGNGYTIDGGGIDRVLDHHAGPLSLLEVTITGGHTNVENYEDATGAGLNTHGGPATLIEVTVSGNSARSHGGGIFSGATTYFPYHPAAPLRIYNSSITDNTSGNFGSGVAGGGLGSISDGTDIEIHHTLIARNSAEGGAGGFYVSASGFWTTNTILVSDSIIEDNEVQPYAVFGSSAGGFFTDNVDVTIERSIIRSNTAEASAAFIHEVGGFRLVDSLVTGNFATKNSLGATTAEIHHAFPTLDIRNTTIVDNLHFHPNAYTMVVTLVDPDWGTPPSILNSIVNSIIEGQPGGVALHLSRPIGSELGLSVSGSVFDAGTACTGNEPPISLGYNWFSDTTCSPTGTDLIGSDPMLWPLQDNGGPTETMLPAAGSPLIDAIPWSTPGICDGTYPADARGLPRPSPAATACDIGAVERQPTDP